jgi:hypothetical protein
MVRKPKIKSHSTDTGLVLAVAYYRKTYIYRTEREKLVLSRVMEFVTRSAQKAHFAYF